MRWFIGVNRLHRSRWIAARCPFGGVSWPTKEGRSDQFERAVARWTVQYADQAERDVSDLQSAVQYGRLSAEYGV